MSDAYKTTVILHSKSGCPYCDEARAFLALHQIPVTEIKHEDRADREALYDSFGLLAPNRTVPQIVITADGENFHVGGAKALRNSGIQSLFGSGPVGMIAPAQSRAVKAAEATQMVAAEEGHSCCE